MSHDVTIECQKERDGIKSNQNQIRMCLMRASIYSDI
jgi:hypothetical protein